MIEFFEALNTYPGTAVACAVFILALASIIVDGIKKK